MRKWHSPFSCENFVRPWWTYCLHIILFPSAAPVDPQFWVSWSAAVDRDPNKKQRHPITFSTCYSPLFPPQQHIASSRPATRGFYCWLRNKRKLLQSITIEISDMTWYQTLYLAHETSFILTDFWYSFLSLSNMLDCNF